MNEKLERIVPPEARAESKLLEQVEMLTSKICSCLGSAREIDSKLYNPTPSNKECEEKLQPNLENYMTNLHSLVDDLNSLLSYINRKL